MTEGTETARFLRYRHREQRFPTLTDLGALGHVTKPVEIYVRATADGNESLFTSTAICAPALHAGDGERTGRLHQCARLVEHVLDRRRHLVDGDQHDFVEQILAQRVGEFADLPDRNTIGKQADTRQADSFARGQCTVHGSGIDRFHTDDAYLGPQVLQVSADAGGQPATADGHEDHIERIGVLATELDGNCALACDGIGSIKGVNEGESPFLAEGHGMRKCGVEIVAEQDGLTAKSAHRVDLDRRCGDRHDDDGGDFQPVGSQRDALGMVARRSGNHAGHRAAAGPLALDQLVDAIEGAAALEREDHLLVFALQQHPVAKACGEERRIVQTRLLADVVDARRQDAFDVLFVKLVHAAARGFQVRVGPPMYPDSNRASATDRERQIAKDRSPKQGRQRTWPLQNRDSPMSAGKQAAAEAALDFVRGQRLLGIGTGSTVNLFIDALAASGMQIEGAVSSSEQTSQRLASHGVEVLDLNMTGSLDVYIDGADEVEPGLALIKGGGGALTREKIVAAASREFICLVDDSKHVDVLGDFGVPVEVIPMARSYVAREIVQLGADPEYREGPATDNGNIILDCYGFHIDDAVALEARLNAIVGVVCNGLFAARPANRLITGYADGRVEVMPPRP